VLKKAITYEDFNGERVTEEFFFHLSKAELIELELSHDGGLSESLQRIIAAEDGKAIIAEFKNIILTSYGQRSPDGRRFIKNQQLRDEFESTEAYSELFMQLVTDTEEAILFINGIVPAGMAEQAAATLAAVPSSKDLMIPEPEPEPEVEVKLDDVEVRLVTQADVAAMSQEEIDALGAQIARGEVKLGFGQVAE
jgi:hypothetical protein